MKSIGCRAVPHPVVSSANEGSSDRVSSVVTSSSLQDERQETVSNVHKAILFIIIIQLIIDKGREKYAVRFNGKSHKINAAYQYAGFSGKSFPYCFRIRFLYVALGKN
jgi:hypothetical protein